MVIFMLCGLRLPTVIFHKISAAVCVEMLMAGNGSNRARYAWWANDIDIQGSICSIQHISTFFSAACMIERSSIESNTATTCTIHLTFIADFIQLFLHRHWTLCQNLGHHKGCVSKVKSSEFNPLSLKTFILFICQ
jgi:hypothetical protein